LLFINLFLIFLTKACLQAILNAVGVVGASIFLPPELPARNNSSSSKGTAAVTSLSGGSVSSASLPAMVKAVGVSQSSPSIAIYTASLGKKGAAEAVEGVVQRKAKVREGREDNSPLIGTLSAGVVVDVLDTSLAADGKLRALVRERLAANGSLNGSLTDSKDPSSNAATAADALSSSAPSSLPASSSAHKSAPLIGWITASLIGPRRKSAPLERADPDNGDGDDRTEATSRSHRQLRRQISLQRPPIHVAL